MPENREVRRRHIRVRSWSFKIMFSTAVPLGTVLACALTTKLRRAKAPENVLLNENEADLNKQSVVVVSQVLTIDKSELIDKIGSLSKQRINEILEGIKFLTEPREVDEEIE